MRKPAFERHNPAGENSRRSHAGTHLHGDGLSEIQQLPVEIEEPDPAGHLVEVSECGLGVIQTFGGLLHHQSQQAVAEQRLRIPAHRQDRARTIKWRSLTGIGHR